MTIVAIRRTVDAASEPLTTAEAKLHLRVDHSSEDALIASLITTARQIAENSTQRAFITQTWAITFSEMPEIVELPRPPFIALTTLEYRDTSGNWQTLAQSGLDTIIGSVCAQLDFRNLVASPTLGDYQEVIRATWTAGYGAASAVPLAIKQWMLMHIGSAYAARELEIIGQGYTATRIAFADRLLDPYRVEYA